MRKTFSVLDAINGEDLTAACRNHGAFVTHLGKCLLLALCEKGILDDTQYRKAEDALKKRSIGAEKTE